MTWKVLDEWSGSFWASSYPSGFRIEYAVCEKEKPAPEFDEYSFTQMLAGGDSGD